MIRRVFLIGLFTAASAFLAAPVSAVPSFTPESGQRLADASPQSITGNYADGLRLYFLRNFNVLSATSTDGLSWAEDGGIRISSLTSGGSTVVFSSVTSASVLPLDTTGFRMVLTVQDALGAFRVVSASSADGLNWGLEGTKFSLSSGSYAGSARLFELSDGSWRLFYVRSLNASFTRSNFRVFVATSGDEGVTWGPGVQAFSDEAHSIAVSSRTDGLLRLYYTAPLSGNTTATQLLSATAGQSALSLGFSKEAGVRLSTPIAVGLLDSPLIFRASESFRLRAYYAFLSTGTQTSSVTVSALTLSPDPQRILPNAVVRTAAAGTYTISGEIFDSSPTVKLVKSGQTDIVGTAVSRINDQSFTATFNTQNAELGLWNLKVINGDAVSTTLPNAFTITFEAGRVTAIDNVFRPLRNQQVHFDVDVFSEGKVTVKVYTLEGRFIRTLLDGDVSVGTTGINWDGRTDDGNSVASGVYLVSFEGPKLDIRKKIVVIR